MCIHCVRVSLNPMTGVIICISVKRFERAFGPEKSYIRTRYYYYLHVQDYSEIAFG